MDKAVDKFVGGGQPEGLGGVDLIDTLTGEKSHIEADGAFVAIGHKPATELFAGQLPLDEGYLVVDKGHDPHEHPRRVRGRRRHRQDLPPGP